MPEGHQGPEGMTAADLEAILKSPRTALQERWRGLFDAEPPTRISNAMMARIILSELQWRSSGLSRTGTIRRLQKAAAASETPGPATAAGDQLVRDWNGRRHVVEVRGRDYVWNGKTYRSLSAVAREITGARWSGPRFFGVSG